MLFQIFYFIVVWLTFVKCSKYDLDAESQKLYGEDLKGTLNRFRRSYDYLKILEEKQYVISCEIEDSLSYLSAYYVPLMQTRVQEMFGKKEEAKGEPPVPEAANRLRHLRNDDKEEDETQDVQLLDEYLKSARVLTVPEINTYVNLGFEYAGKVIHDIIRHMDGSGDGSPPKVTKLSGQDDGPTSPSHPTEHIVTNEGPFMSTQPPDQQGAKEEKDYSYRAQRDPQKGAENKLRALEGELRRKEPPISRLSHRGKVEESSIMDIIPRTVEKITPYKTTISAKTEKIIHRKHETKAELGKEKAVVKTDTKTGSKNALETDTKTTLKTEIETTVKMTSKLKKKNKRKKKKTQKIPVTKNVSQVPQTNLPQISV